VDSFAWSEIGEYRMVVVELIVGVAPQRAHDVSALSALEKVTPPRWRLPVWQRPQ